MLTLEGLLAFARAQVQQKTTTRENKTKNTKKRVEVSQTDKIGIFGGEKHRVEKNDEAQFRGWIDTLEPVPKRALSPLLPEEERHLRDFIKKLKADQMGRLSGSDLWALQAQYEGESGFCFNMWPDCFSAHVARAMGACEMTDGNGQAWLVGVICR